MSRYAAYLHSIGFSQKELLRIFTENSDFEDFYKNLKSKDLKEYSINQKRIDEIMSGYSNFDESKIDKELDRLKVNIILHSDENYPENLKYIPNPPFIIYVRGKLDNTISLISIVGSRKCTTYSEIVLKSIIPGMIKSGFGIVSGGAYGVDSIAHNLTLNNSGYTICAIGTGIDVDYPKSNSGLYNKIVEKGGAIISIFRLGTTGDAFNFPIRNEIIAGISKGTLITEATDKSGTLITARLALELNKEVFAIPGDITREGSFGCNSLLRDGLAKAIIGYEDILSEYSLNSKIEDKKIIQMSLEDSIEQSIVELIHKNPLDASTISDKLGKDISTVSFKLSIMEVRGDIILREGGLYYLN